jgi:hypothetical protein
MRRRRSREEERELLLEAFLGGWQAALGRYVHPRARGVVEACFDRWLEEAADEVDVFGLAFRRRAGLPQRLAAPSLRFDLTTGALLDQDEPSAPQPAPRPAPAPPPAGVVRVPRQRGPHGRSRSGRDTRGGRVTAAAPER